MQLFKYLGVILSFLPVTALAEWAVVTHTNTDNNFQTNVAQTVNEEGFSLEIYQDNAGVIRSRFSMHSNTGRIATDHCPSFQVDSNPVRNHSINDAMCITTRKWSEYVLGYTINNQINSTMLMQYINGNRITWRFKLENSGYIETGFSLSGSKKALTDAIGKNLAITNDI